MSEVATVTPCDCYACKTAMSHPADVLLSAPRIIRALRGHRFVMPVAAAMFVGMELVAAMEIAEQRFAQEQEREELRRMN